MFLSGHAAENRSPCCSSASDRVRKIGRRGRRLNPGYPQGHADSAPTRPRLKIRGICLLFNSGRGRGTSVNAQVLCTPANADCLTVYSEHVEVVAPCLHHLTSLCKELC